MMFWLKMLFISCKYMCVCVKGDCTCGNVLAICLCSHVVLTLCMSISDSLTVPTYFYEIIKRL